MRLADSIQLPTKRIQLPKSKEWLNIRCFTSKEQKNLKMGLQTNSPETVSSTLQQVFESCVQEDIRIGKLDLIDLEYLFLQLTVMSSGSYVDVGYQCLAEVEGKKCGHEFDVQYDLEAVDYEFSDTEDLKIFDVVEGVQIEMKKATGKEVFEYFSKMVKEEEIKDDIEDQIISNMSAIFLKDTRNDPKDYSREEIIEFLDVVPINVIAEMQTYLGAVDELVLRKEFRCPSCGSEHKIEMRGMESFLG